MILTNPQWKFPKYYINQIYGNLHTLTDRGYWDTKRMNHNEMFWA